MVDGCTRWLAACCATITSRFSGDCFRLIENVLEVGFFKRKEEWGFIPLDGLGRSSGAVIDVFERWRGVRYDSKIACII